jgi:hypothetical protein
MDIPVSKVRKVLKIAQEPISLETPIGEEEDSHLGDFIEDKSILNPADAVVASNLREITDEVLATLTPREEKVIKMRFGLGTTGSGTYPGRSRTALRGDSRTYSSDRSKGTSQTTPSISFEKVESLSRRRPTLIHTVSI